MLDGLFGGFVPPPPAPPPDPAPALVLALLRESPKHRDWLRGKVTDPAAAVAALKAAGHVVKSIILYGRTDWVYALSENGRLCGVEGKAGEDSETAPAGEEGHRA